MHKHHDQICDDPNCGDNRVQPFKIIEADRPDGDTAAENAAWIQMIRRGLGYRLPPDEESTRQRRFDQLEFVECDACAVKPGSPILCSGCLANRHIIGRLKAL